MQHRKEKVNSGIAREAVKQLDYAERICTFGSKVSEIKYVRERGVKLAPSSRSALKHKRRMKDATASISRSERFAERDIRRINNA